MLLRSEGKFQRTGRPRRYPELERLICRAVSEERFARQLVTEPAIALAELDHGSRLSPVEREMVTSIIGATDIYEFAARLHAKVQQANELRAPPYTWELAPHDAVAW